MFSTLWRNRLVFSLVIRPLAWLFRKPTELEEIALLSKQFQIDCKEFFREEPSKPRRVIELDFNPWEGFATVDFSPFVEPVPFAVEVHDEKEETPKEAQPGTDAGV